jgi:hypothetical protein
MANFYYGCDENVNYWINLDHVCFAKPELNKLILKLVDGTVFQIQGQDEIAIKQYFWEKSLNWEDQHITAKELIDADKRHNHEDIPRPEYIPPAEDWQTIDWDDDDDHEIFIV